MQVRVTMVTDVRHNEQPGDLEAGEGAQVTRALRSQITFERSGETMLL